MQINPISYSCSNSNKIKSKNVSEVNFLGAKQKLISVNTDSFRTKEAKKIYDKIQGYLKLLKEGSIKNVKILHENRNGKECYVLRESDILLSINRSSDNFKLRLSKKYNDHSESTLLEANFDKNGQMFSGYDFERQLHFERTNSNLRRMSSMGNTYLPVGQNDKEWQSNGSTINTIPLIDCVSDGVYEIFIELARLHTSILK